MSSGNLPNDFYLCLGEYPQMKELTKKYVLEMIDAGIEKYGSISEFERVTGLGKQRVKDIRRAKGVPPASDWEKIKAAVLSENSGNQVPVIAEIGAGAKIFPIDDLPLIPNGLREHDQQEYINCEFVDAPPGHSYGVVALKVKGDSMLPFMPTGTIVYYERKASDCSENIGKLSIVALPDGSVLLKTLRRGFGYDRYNLESYNAPLIENVELLWCAKVIFIKPA